MSTPRSKYSKKQTQKKEIRDGAINSNDDRTEENGAEHSGAPKVSAVVSTISCHSAPCCRICHDDDTDETLISPCNCKGSMNYCHSTCLRSWLTEKVQNLKEPSCEICKCVYEVRYERIGRRGCGVPLRQLRGQREFIHFIIVSFCVMVLAASIAYTTWGAFSTSDLAINFRMSPLAELTYSVYLIIDALCVLVIIVEFNVGIMPLIKKWWNSNLSVVVIDKNKVAICTENLRVLEEASSLLEDEEEDEVEDEEEEEFQDEEMGEAGTGSNLVRGGGDVARPSVSGWWVKLWTCQGQANSGESEVGAVQLGGVSVTATVIHQATEGDTVENGTLTDLPAISERTSNQATVELKE